ncbi:hypothetical protein CG419_00905 [Latilactobacillus curvatus]|uniref:WxL domain-containing protein n=1 Tax=Latilactobacillus curvatus TaxID=28038 RepID=A0AAC9UMD3_LATCU|nr:WxL domain-containing protein [Latilactobacillus curvatus]ASN59277.1 hypothetical protein CG419_00905 [Latilactobacillus curvatus]
MKQTQFVLFATITLAGATLANTVGVKAADTSDLKVSAKTTAQFTVKAGELQLDSAPDFNFGKDIDIPTIMQGDLTQVTQGGNSVEGDSDSHIAATAPESKLNSETDTLQVKDYRGADSNWTLFASMGDFVNTTDENSKATGVLTLKATGTSLENSTIDNKNQVIMSSKNIAPALLGATTTTAQFKAGSTVKLSNQTRIKAGTYNAAITWTLMDGLRDAVA